MYTFDDNYYWLFYYSHTSGIILLSNVDSIESTLFNFDPLIKHIKHTMTWLMNYLGILLLVTLSQDL